MQVIFVFSYWHIFYFKFNSSPFFQCISKTLLTPGYVILLDCVAVILQESWVFLVCFLFFLFAFCFSFPVHLSRTSELHEVMPPFSPVLTFILINNI